VVFESFKIWFTLNLFDKYSKDGKPRCRTQFKVTQVEKKQRLWMLEMLGGCKICCAKKRHEKKL